MQNGEPNVYAAIVTMRNTYMLMQWQKVQMFLGFNIIGVPLLYAEEVPLSLKTAISIIGLLVHFGLLVASRRAEQWIRLYDVKLATLERYSDIGAAESKIRVPLFSDEEVIGFRNVKTASRFLFGYIGIAIMIYWGYNSAVYLFGG